MRQETCRIPEGHLLDISLTRFLFDQKMRSDEEFDFLKPHVDKIPRSWAYSKNLLRMAQTGRVFTSSRLHAAGLAPDNLCISCGEKETVRHLFCDCPAYSRTRNAPVEPGHDVTMLTGVVFLPLFSSNHVVSRAPSDRVGLFSRLRLFLLMGLVTKAIGTRLPRLRQHIFFPRSAILRASSPRKIARARGRKFLQQHWRCHIPVVLSPLLVIV